MTRYLPPNLLALFRPRDPLPYEPPIQKRKMPSYTGVSQYLYLFQTQKNTPPPPPMTVMSREDKLKQKKQQKQLEEMKKIEDQIKVWDPHNNPKSTDEPYKTLFIARLNFKTTKETLKREFEMFGPIKQVKMVYDLEGKPRGYAFLEYERERDVRTAYKDADGRKIDGRRVLVDKERGRVQQEWRPRRLGGGRGGTRRGGDDVNTKYSGRSPPRKRSKSEDHKDRPKRDSGRHRERSREHKRDYKEREGGRDGGREGGREGGWNEGRDNREGGRDNREREGGRDNRERDGGREGGREERDHRDRRKRRDRH